MSNEKKQVVFVLSEAGETSKKMKKKMREKFVVLHDFNKNDKQPIEEKKIKNEKEKEKKDDNLTIIIDSIDNNSNESNQEPLENILEEDKKNQVKINLSQSEKNNNNNINNEINQCKFIYIFYLFNFSKNNVRL